MSTKELAADLYTEHYWSLVSLARAHCGGLDAEALTQDAFILFVEHFDPACGSPPLAWLRLTLKRHCWLTYKRERRHSSSDQLDEFAMAISEQARADRSRTPDEVAEARETASEGYRALSGLKVAERAALVDLGLGYSYREIETRRGWTYTKINRCIAEGRAALKAAVA